MPIKRAFKDETSKSITTKGTRASTEYYQLHIQRSVVVNQVICFSSIFIWQDSISVGVKGLLIVVYVLAPGKR